MTIVSEQSAKKPVYNSWYKHYVLAGNLRESTILVVRKNDEKQPVSNSWYKHYVRTGN